MRQGSDRPFTLQVTALGYQEARRGETDRHPSCLQQLSGPAHVGPARGHVGKLVCRKKDNGVQVRGQMERNGFQCCPWCAKPKENRKGRGGRRHGRGEPNGGMKSVLLTQTVAGGRQIWSQEGKHTEVVRRGPPLLCGQTAVPPPWISALWCEWQFVTQSQIPNWNGGGGVGFC